MSIYEIIYIPYHVYVLLNQYKLYLDILIYFLVLFRGNDTSVEVCHGRGQCLCGRCDCYPITPGDTSVTFSGKYCQCNDYSCDFHDGKLCGGACAFLNLNIK